MGISIKQHDYTATQARWKDLVLKVILWNCQKTWSKLRFSTKIILDFSLRKYDFLYAKPGIFLSKAILVFGLLTFFQWNASCPHCSRECYPHLAVQQTIWIKPCLEQTRSSHKLFRQICQISCSSLQKIVLCKVCVHTQTWYKYNGWRISHK